MVAIACLARDLPSFRTASLCTMYNLRGLGGVRLLYVAQSQTPGFACRCHSASDIRLWSSSVVPGETSTILPSDQPLSGFLRSRLHWMTMSGDSFTTIFSKEQYRPRDSSLRPLTMRSSDIGNQSAIANYQSCQILTVIALQYPLRIY